MNTEKIKQILKKYLFFLKFRKKHEHSKIYHHWEYVLFTFVVINVLFFGFNLYLFLEINGEGIFLVEQNEEVHIDTIDRKKIQELIASFDIKQTLFEDRIISAPKLPDPSIDSSKITQ